MLASPWPRPFSDEDWLFEPKWDGYRMILTFESTTAPGAEGCRDSSGGAVSNPVGLSPLSLSVGWYGCSHMEDDHEAQLQIVDVEIDPDRVIVEMVVWDFSP